MKNFIICLLCLSMMFVANSLKAQESASYDYDLGYTGTWSLHSFSSPQGITATDSVWYFTVRKFSTNKVFPSAKIVLDKTTGTPTTIIVTLERRIWSDDTWTVESTVNYAGTVDTTIIVQGSTARVADYWRMKIRRASGNFVVIPTEVGFKLAY